MATKKIPLDSNGLPVASLANSTPGTVSAFQARTEAQAKKAGFTVTKKGQVWTLTKGNTTLVVNHSQKGYVRKVTLAGKPVILPGHQQKWIKLQGILQELA